MYIGTASTHQQNEQNDGVDAPVLIVLLSIVVLLLLKYVYIYI